LRQVKEFIQFILKLMKLLDLKIVMENMLAKLKAKTILWRWE